MNQTIADYRNHPAYSYSTLKAYLKSPLHGYTQVPPQETASMRFGSAVDLIVKGDKSFVINPHPDGRTKLAKEWKSEHEGKLVLTREEADKAEACASAVLASEAVKSLCLNIYESDKPLFGELDEIQVRGLPDWIFANTIIDLKTTTGSVEPRSFARVVDNFHYDMQAAMYRHLAEQNGEDSPTFYWIVVENEKPFDVAVYRATDEIFWVGRTKLKAAIHNLKLAQSGFLHGAVLMPQALQMPSWYGGILGD